MRNHIGQRKEGNRAFALLFAVLASSLLIAIGVSIFNISFKELQIATSEQASQAAYYAADSAQECATYWSVTKNGFPECLDAGCGAVSTTTTPTVTCNGVPVTIQFAKNGLSFSGATTTFIGFGGIGDPSASLVASTTYNPATNRITTVITTFGHNSGIVGRRVERGITEVHNN
ncbi:MAG: hypothetical protein KGH93_00220 [Patescibacteria group bacterium]|nr:hypothetical protein [Patescibacteria group bacterium]MDE1945618.1 hypothetical protein [Patescibacteria group bacterium]